MGPIEMVFVDTKKVSCDGGKGAMGHPLIYLEMGNKDGITCPYCSRYFTVKKSPNIFVSREANQNFYVE